MLKNICDHTFLDRLSEESNIIDLGLNRAEFVNSLFSIYGCHSFGLEANPELFDKLPKVKYGSYINAAAAGTSGKTIFNKI